WGATPTAHWRPCGPWGTPTSSCSGHSVTSDGPPSKSGPPSITKGCARPRRTSRREWADRFNAAGAAARRAGIWLAFHNEADHMTPIDGTVPYDVFVQRTDSTVVRHQLDVGNMIMGGGDPFAYLERYRDRYWSFHLKDVVKDRSRDTELGTGTVPLTVTSEADRSRYTPMR